MTPIEVGEKVSAFRGQSTGYSVGSESFDGIDRRVRGSECISLHMSLRKLVYSEQCSFIVVVVKLVKVRIQGWRE